MSEASIEDIRKEIAEARRILREDGHSVRLAAIEAKLAKAFPDEPEEPSDGQPKPPEKKEEPNSDETKKVDKWWGDRLNVTPSA